MPRQCISTRNKNIKEREENKHTIREHFTKIRKQLSENVQLQLKFDKI